MVCELIIKYKNVDIANKVVYDINIKGIFLKLLLSAVAAICIHVILKLNIGDLRLLYGMFFKN